VLLNKILEAICVADWHQSDSILF